MVNQGMEARAIIILDSAPKGLAGYNIIVSLKSGEVADIVRVEFPEWAKLSDSSITDGSIRLKAVDLGDMVRPGATNIVLATIIFGNTKQGESLIELTIVRMDDDYGNPITPFIEPGKLTVIGPSAAVTITLALQPIDSGGLFLYREDGVVRGATSGSPTLVTVIRGERGYFLIRPAPGYELDKIVVDGVTYTSPQTPIIVFDKDMIATAYMRQTSVYVSKPVVETTTITIEKTMTITTLQASEMALFMTLSIVAVVIAIAVSIIFLTVSKKRRTG